jgi:2Fe-2S ferredoxin
VHHITFVPHIGERTVLSFADDSSVMRAAVNNDVDGIVGECGGQLMCATCHVYVESVGLGELPEISEDEDMMLDTTASPRLANSRLSCQLLIGPRLDDVVVTLPESQI